MSNAESLIEVFGLTDCAEENDLSQASTVANRIAEFIGAAEQTLVLALYDCLLYTSDAADE